MPVIRDTTPFARERNNLTTEVDPNVLRRIIRIARAKGVDPNAALATAWKETLFGNKGIIGRPWSNPMQYNARDIGYGQYLTDINSRLKEDPSFKEAVTAVSTPSIIPSDRKGFGTDKTLKPTFFPPSKDELKFQEARMLNRLRDATQQVSTEGGVNYLKKMIDKNPGNLEGAFAQYRGKGQAAKYHGRHVMALYEAIKKDPVVKGLLKEEELNLVGND